AQTGGACLPPRPGDKFCALCGGLWLCGSYDQSKYHQSRAVARNGAAAEPQRVSDASEHPDAVVCFGARMARDPGFAAAVLTAAGLGGVCAPLPPVLPGLTT
ncbi:unnamed protein product, partial [Ixodes hexagonus]